MWDVVASLVVVFVGLGGMAVAAMALAFSGVGVSESHLRQGKITLIAVNLLAIVAGVAVVVIRSPWWGLGTAFGLAFLSIIASDLVANRERRVVERQAKRDLIASEKAASTGKNVNNSGI